jgi:hypothetical protein
MMKKLLLIALASGLVYGCSNSKPKTETDAPAKQNTIETKNDMENASAVIPSWINEKTVIAMKEPAAHSGKFASITSDTAEYGYGYQELVKNISSGIPKKVSISGWIYTTAPSPNFSIILSISEKTQNIDWKAYSLADQMKESGKWVEFSSEFYFDKPMNPEQEIKIYPWNQAKKTVYVDDMKISFEY